MDYPKMAGDVVHTIERFGIVRPVLIGHSMGGKAAMAVAQLDLTPISGLVVADIAPVPYRHDHEEFIAAMESLDLGTIKSRGDADRLMAAHISETGVRQFLLQNLVRDKEVYRWRIHIEAIRRNLPELLDWKITRPSDQTALFIAGGQSPYINSSGRDAIHTLYSRATIETIAEAGHWLHAEQPQVFTGLVQEFLESVHSTH